MQNFGVRRDAKGRYARLQDLARAELLHRSLPNSTAAQEFAAYERRAALIAQMHKQPIIAADDKSSWQATLKARIDKDARRHKNHGSALCRNRLYRGVGLCHRPIVVLIARTRPPAQPRGSKGLP
jgi:hypothetical protein